MTEDEEEYMREHHRKLSNRYLAELQRIVSEDSEYLTSSSDGKHTEQSPRVERYGASIIQKVVHQNLFFEVPGLLIIRR